MVYSASNVVALDDYNDSFYYYKKQLLFMIVGFIIMFIIIKIDINKIRNISFFIFLFLLFTTNKIYIELKNSTDFIKLQSVISVYNLLIIRQNKYMPLWYTVSITKQTPYNTIQMANILYELGYFLSVEPEFRFNAKESISWDTYVGEQWGLYNATGNKSEIL